MGLGYTGPIVNEAASDPNSPLLVADSVYESDVTDDGRRGEPQGFSLTANDDAMFSPAEFERLLRANDADAGRLPDRLWKLVDAFDPAKLAVQQTSTTNGVQTDGINTVELVQAQIEAAIRRRAVTTDSVEIPTPAEGWTSRLVYGADGRPGVAAFDDDTNLVVDNAAELNIFGDGVMDPGEVQQAITAFENGVDDYMVVMGAAPPANARLLDYLRYRVVLELKRRGVIPSGLMPDIDRSQVVAYGYTLADLDEVERLVNNVIYGNNSAPVSLTRTEFATFGGLLAPELLAGQKMDVNRPFGDGRDNNGNGVVDEPAEAGEPWIDANGDGEFTGDGTLANSEPFLDLNNNGFFDPSVDSLYGDQLGVPVPFDHVRGVDANGRGVIAGTGAIVHDDGQMARQLYARHLYCLMLLVMDENYLVPFDDKDPQVAEYLDPDSVSIQSQGTGQPNIERRSVANQIKLDLIADRGLAEADAQAEARRIALRKLTCRKIAQWAINCVEMRDPDAICTPFEYDENPWDGWNVVDSRGSRVFPLDGDVTTDENYQYTRDVSESGWTAPQRVNGYNGAAIPDTEEVAHYEQTRGLVWGMERAELLLTEGMGLHDRRVSNESAGGFLSTGEANQNQEDSQVDDDLDQFYRPKGSAFVEVYNPWPTDGPLPAELYRDRFGQFRFCEMDRDSENNGPPIDTNLDGIADNGDARSDVLVQGVLLDRLSDGEAEVLDSRGVAKGFTAPSPVWRMICIEQHPQLRNDDPFDNELELGGSDYLRFEPGPIATDRAPAAYTSIADASRDRESEILGTLSGQNAFRPTTTQVLSSVRAALNDPFYEPARLPDPDFPTFDREALPSVSKNGERFTYKKPLEYIEREWYFTRGASFDRSANVPGWAGSQPPLDPQDVQLCIPDRPVRFRLGSGGFGGAQNIGSDNLPKGAEAYRELWPEGVTQEVFAGGATLGDVLVYRRSFPPIIEMDGNEQDAVRRIQYNPFTAGFGGNEPVDRYRTLPLAPILPGQYGVIGSAGFEYTQLPGRYITRIGRLEGEDANVIASGDRTVNQSRRIELVPSRNPYLHQVCVGRNLGDEYRLMAPAGPNNEFLVNATDPSSIPKTPNSLTDTIAGVGSLKEFNDDPTQPAFYTNTNDGIQAYEIDPSNADDMRLYCIRPAVAIPMVGMNISEPLDHYVLRRSELEARPVEEGGQGTASGFSKNWRPDEYAGEGRYENTNNVNTENGYDTPFDIAPELIVNHTTPNYRSVHLQRLANPLLAWNPAPLKVDGTAHPQHDPTRAVNPYLTVRLDVARRHRDEQHQYGRREGEPRRRERCWAERGHGLATTDRWLGGPNELWRWWRP